MDFGHIGGKRLTQQTLRWRDIGDDLKTVVHYDVYVRRLPQISKLSNNVDLCMGSFLKRSCLNFLFLLFFVPQKLL